MRACEDTEAWLRYHVIIGHRVSSSRANSARIIGELEEAGCSDQLASRLMSAAMTTGIIIDRIMGKTI